MKKIIGVILVLLSLTGCTKINFDSMTEDELINSVLYKEISLFNKNYEGYKLYVPRGLKVIEKNDYNLEILDEDSNYYLYVDIVAYYHNTEVEFSQKNNNYISKKINYGDKLGYLDVTEFDSKSYHVEYYFNYGKIEALINKDDLKQSLVNMTTILSSIDYSKDVIEALMSKDILNYKEEKINLFESKERTSSFLEALEKYDNYVEDTEKDQDVLDFEDLE